MTELSGTARELARTVLVHGPISRAELAARLGLSVASLSRLGKPLIDAGLLVEREPAGGGAVGRPVRLIDVRAEAETFLGIKIAGDSVSGVRTDLRANELAAHRESLSGTSPEEVVAALRRLAARLRSGGGAVSRAGVSIGGKVDGAGTVIRAPFLGWRNVALQSRLEESLGLPVVLENDVVALTVAEQWFGAGRQLSSFAVLTIGAGVGYGLVINGQVIAPPDAGLGLGGHYPLDPGGPRCPLGHAGCATALLSIPAITGQVSAALDRRVEYDGVLELARAGSPEAAAVVTAAGHGLGKMIAAIANLAMVPAVVLAGEGVGLLPVVEAALESALLADRDPEAAPVRLLRGSAGFNLWARGAAAVAIQAQILGSDFDA